MDLGQTANAVNRRSLLGRLRIAKFLKFELTSFSPSLAVALRATEDRNDELAIKLREEAIWRSPSGAA